MNSILECMPALLLHPSPPPPPPRSLKQYSLWLIIIYDAKCTFVSFLILVTVRVLFLVSQLVYRIIYHMYMYTLLVKDMHSAPSGAPTALRVHVCSNLPRISNIMKHVFTVTCSMAAIQIKGTTYSLYSVEVF